MTQPTEEQITKFILSSELQGLSERLKTSDGLLDLITLVENQHSSVIAWMCDSREGHGQGEAILRDLLCHASAVAQGRFAAKSATNLKGSTASFFRNWTPAKLLTTSLSASFISAEFAERADDRLDMLVIDPSNHLLIAIENKVKAKVGPGGEQLTRYRKFVEGLRKKRPLKGFDAAFILIDKKLDDDDETAYAASVGNEYNNWLALSYEWLKHAADRSTLQLAKGQLGGRLIQIYCRQQIGWESPDDNACSRLAASLWTEHREVVTSLCDMTKRPDKCWVLSKTATKTTPQTLQLFALQNRHVLRALLDAKGFIAVSRQLREDRPDLPEELIRSARVRMDVIPRCLSHLFNKETRYGPLFLRARLIDDDTCKLQVIFDARHLAPGYSGLSLRAWAKEIAGDIEKDIESRIRRITVVEKVKLDNLHKELIAWDRKFEELSKNTPLSAPSIPCVKE